MSKKKLFAVMVATAAVSSILTVLCICLLLGLDANKLENTLRFIGALRFVEMRYVDEVNYESLMDGAINGMVKSLGDPHSIYMAPNLYRRLTEHTEGAFGGIGVYMGFKNGKVEIISVMEGTPGEKAGLKANDEILAVDGTPTAEIQPEEVAMRIRGEAGTDVELTVHRDGEDDKSYKIKRDTIKVTTAAGKMLEDGMGYIRIASFSEDTANEFKTAYEKLLGEGMKGLVLDLRENPGGLITSVVDVADMIVPAGLVVSVVQRDGEREEYFSSASENQLPMTVLIDGNSASAAEILAGALQDNKAATIVGETSYGKGSVQIVLPLFHSDAVKLTIAKYYTPNGRSIDGTGVEPDVPVGFDINSVEDVQLEKAKEILRNEIR